MDSLSGPRGVFAMSCMVEGKTRAGGLGRKTARPACPGLLADELVIVGMGSDPEPQHSITGLHGQGSIMKPHTGRQKTPDFLQSQRRMLRIFFQ